MLIVTEKTSYGLGTTTERVTVEIKPFPYARETKHITLKDLETYLIPDVLCISPLSFSTLTWIDT